MSAVHRLARRSGVASVLVAFAGILAAVATDPAFSWTDSALSDLGVATDATALLFNGGLLVAGALAVPFAWWVAATAETRAGRAAGVAFASAACMAGVGAFPSGTPFHAPMAVGFYLLFTGALALDASDAVLVGDSRRALAWFWAALGHLTAWLVWAALSAAGVLPGLAVPETVGALVLATWVVTSARETRQRGR